MPRLLFFLLFTQPLISQSFFFIQLTDPQFGMYPLTRDFSKERANMAKAAEAVNRLRPAFVTVTGDLVNAEGDSAQIRAFRESFALIDPAIPVHLVAGNHDVGNTPTERSLQTYRDAFGPDYYAYTYEGVRFIVLNSSLIKSPREARTSEELQERWLSSLDSARSILFMHHPLFLSSMMETSDYFNITTGPRRQYAQYIRSKGVGYIFAGHTHENNEAEDDGLHVVATGSIGMPLGMDPPGLRIVIVSTDTIVHRYYALDEVPVQVDASAFLK